MGELKERVKLTTATVRQAAETEAALAKQRMLDRKNARTRTAGTTTSDGTDAREPAVSLQPEALSCGAAGATAGIPPQASRGSPEPLPQRTSPGPTIPRDCWLTLRHPCSNRMYYLNTVTGSAQWIAPGSDGSGSTVPVLGHEECPAMYHMAAYAAAFAPANSEPT